MWLLLYETIKIASPNISLIKGGLRQISILYWMWGETVTKDEEKANALHTFFTSIFIVKPIILKVSRLLSWKTGMGSRMEPP